MPLEIAHSSQVYYRHGGYMCTSACLCMCLMLLGGEIDTAVASSGIVSVDEDQKKRSIVDYFSSCAGKAMEMSSVVQGKVENVLSSPPPRSGRGGRMLGVWEILSTLSLSPEKMGFRTQELVVVGYKCEGAAGGGRVNNKNDDHDSGDCFISLEELPVRMSKIAESSRSFEHDRKKSRRLAAAAVVGSVVTWDGHSVCVMFDDSSGLFSFFDPMPSRLVVGITASEAVREVSKNRGWVSCSSMGEGAVREHRCDVTLFYA